MVPPRPLKDQAGVRLDVYVPPGSLWAQVGVRSDVTVLPECQTAQVEGLTWTTAGDDDKGPAGPCWARGCRTTKRSPGASS